MLQFCKVTKGNKILFRVKFYYSVFNKQTDSYIYMGLVENKNIFIDLESDILQDSMSLLYVVNNL